MSTKGIYRFYWDAGRQGSLSGIFIATADEVENIIGKDVYFGEVLGKHSEIYGEIERRDIEFISDDPSAVALFESLDLATGYNPLNFLEEEDEAYLLGEQDVRTDC